MSKTVDERVVSMQFDNKQFESNVRTSLSTLDKLKQSLKLDGAAKGFESISKAAKNVDMSPLSSGLDTVKSKFSALEVVAITALANITNSAVNAGKSLVKSLTIDQITAGWNKYEQKTASVQTLVNSTGKSVDDINDYLRKLMWYSDETSYGFVDMTKALSTMTSSGGDIKKLVPMIEGVANATAFAGKGASEFSRIMQYSINQAYSLGYMQVGDWRTIEGATVNSKQLQEALIDAGVELGTIKKGAVTLANFRESLKDKWLTKGVMEQGFGQFAKVTEEIYAGVQNGTFKNYADGLEKIGNKYGEVALRAAASSQEAKTFTEAIDATKDAVSSGWMETFDIIFGNYEKAKVLWTEVSERLWDVFASGGEGRNELLRAGMSSNWDKLITQLDETGVSADKFNNTLTDALKQGGWNVDVIISKYGSLEKAFQQGVISSYWLEKALKSVNGPAADLSKIQKDLKKNDRGNQVKEAQKALKQLGYDIGTFGEDVDGVDGKFGKMTETAVKAFQTMNGLKATGIVDNKTIAALDKAVQGTNEWGDSVHDLITNITEPGGREHLIQSFRNLFDGIGSIVAPIKEAFRDTFSIDGSQVLNFTKRLEDLTSKIKISDETADKLKTTFKGFFSVGQQVGKIAGGVLKTGFNVLGKVLKPTGGLVLNLTSKLGDALIKFSEWVDKNKIIFKVFDGINVAIDKVIGFIQNGIDKIKEFGSAVKDKFAAPGFETFLGVVTKIWETLKNVGSKIIEIAANIGSAIGNAFRSGDIKSVLDVVNGGIIASVLLGIRKYISGITEAFDGSETFIGKIKDLLDIVGDALQAWQQNIKAQTLIKIAAAIAVLAASLIALSLIDSEKLSSSLGAITVLFAELMGSLAIFNKMNLNFGGAAKAVTTMIGMSVAILILASAMKKLSSLSWEEIGKGIAGILGLTAILVAASKIMATEGKKVAKGALQMAIMAAALKILASVCKDLSELSWIELAKGLSGIAVLLAAISLFLNTAKFGGKAISTATGIVILAAALKILASVCKDFSTMKWEEIGKGLAGIAGLLFELAGFTNLAGNAKHVLSTGVALIVIAAAMKIFTNIMNDMSQMSWEEIAKGLTTVGGALLVIAGAMNLLPKGMVAKAVSLIGIAAAITILGNALSSLGEMSWEEIAKGLVALGGSLGILAGGLYLMNGSLAGSAALIVAAVAIGMLAPILKSLGDMSWLQIAKGLVALAGAIAIFGVAALVLTPIIPAMLGLGAAILVFGAGCALAGVGITAIATGLTALGATIVVTASSIVETINTIVKGLGTIITSFCNSVAESAPAIAEAFVAILDATCYTIKESIPLIAETFFELLVEALTLLKTYIPQLADLLADVLISIMDSLAGHMPEFADSFANLIQQFVSSFSNSFGSVFGEIDLSGLVDNIGCISKALLQLSIAAKIISTIPITGALAGIAGFAIMIAGIGGLIVGIGALATEFPQLEEFLNKGIPILIQIGSAIGEFFGTIISSFAEEVISILPAIGEALSGFMTNISGFINGAAAFDSSKMEAIKTLAEAILILTGANLLDSITRFLGGKSSLEEFGAQLVPFGEAMAAFSETVSGKIDAEAVEAAANAGAMLAQLASTLNRNGGLIQKIFGEKDDLKGFGEKLQTFGSAIVTFSSTVSSKGAIDKEAIQKACDATALIVDLANTLPSDNGWLGKVFGDKDTIDGFGSKLTAYANSLKTFCTTLDGTKFDIGKIEEACTATGKIVELAETLPQDPGWFAQVFGGGTDLEKFGEQIASLGTSLSTFNGSIQNVDIEKVSMAVTNLQLIADIASGLNGIDFGNMENLGKAFGNLGNANIQAFINAFATAGPQLISAGANAIHQLINGITSKQPEANQAAANVVASSVTAASNACNGTYGIGQNFVEGFISGIDSLAGAAAAAAANMASGALAAIQAALQIHSPSRKMIEMGENTDRGYIIGLKRMASDVYEAGGEVGKAAKSGIEDTISKKYDDVKKFFGDAPNKISAVLELDTSTAEDKASKFWNSIGGGQSFELSGDISKAFAQNNQNESKTGATSDIAPSYSFTQNNYSPKALSRIDIYRQTKNQFSGWIFNERLEGGIGVEYDEIKFGNGRSLWKRKQSTK